LYIVDRLKDMIKRSGYAVSPAEVERVLAAHPSVAESAVVGVFDAKVGEEVKAFVVLRPGARATAEELIAHCKTQLAAYKYPRLVEFREALPKNAAGKVLRRALRDPA
jgi:long-chain acyl-CoA synthetase